MLYEGLSTPCCSSRIEASYALQHAVRAAPSRQLPAGSLQLHSICAHHVHKPSVQLLVGVGYGGFADQQQRQQQLG
jgi:hypothetical protein